MTTQLDPEFEGIAIFPKKLIPQIAPESLTREDIEQAWNVSFKPFPYPGRYLEAIRADAKRWHRLPDAMAVSLYALRAPLTPDRLFRELEQERYAMVGMIELAALAAAMHLSTTHRDRIYQLGLIAVGLETIIPVGPKSTQVFKAGIEWEVNNLPTFRFLPHGKDKPIPAVRNHRYVGMLLEK